MIDKLYLEMQDRALRASFELHVQMLNECCYAGYDGDKKAFDRLFDEVYAITKDEVPDDADVEYIIETFHEYQLEQMNGEREVGWYL
jgi:hypothetical protein